MTVRTFAAAVLVAALSGGCAAGASQPTGGAPAIRQIELPRLPAVQAHDDPGPLDVTGRSGVADPEQVATALLVEGLTAQGLAVLDIGVSPIRATPDRRTLRIAVAHGASQRSVPHTSVYDVELSRRADGTWAVVSTEAVQ